MLSRIIYGARVSLVVGISATALALAAAVVLGAIAATGRKWIAEALMRTLDVVMSFPGIALAAVLVLALSATLPTLPVVVVSIAVLYVPQLTRVVRANIISQFGCGCLQGNGCLGALDLVQARSSQLHRPDHGFRHGFGGRRDRI